MTDSPYREPAATRALAPLIPGTPSKLERWSVPVAIVGPCVVLAMAFTSWWLGVGIASVATAALLVRSKRVYREQPFANLPFPVSHDRIDALALDVKPRLLRARIRFATTLDMAARERVLAALPNVVLARFESDELVLTGDCPRTVVSELMTTWGAVVHDAYRIAEVDIEWSREEA